LKKSKVEGRKNFKIQPRLQTFGLAACAGWRKRASDDRKLKVESSRRIRNEGSDPGLAGNPQTLAGNLQVRLEVEHTAKEKAIFSCTSSFVRGPLAGLFQGTLNGFRRDGLRKFYD
jgi:hypothetical protein